MEGPAPERAQAVDNRASRAIDHTPSTSAEGAQIPEGVLVEAKVDCRSQQKVSQRHSTATERTEIEYPASSSMLQPSPSADHNAFKIADLNSHARSEARSERAVLEEFSRVLQRISSLVQSRAQSMATTTASCTYAAAATAVGSGLPRPQSWPSSVSGDTSHVPHMGKGVLGQQRLHPMPDTRSTPTPVKSANVSPAPLPHSAARAQPLLHHPGSIPWQRPSPPNNRRVPTAAAINNSAFSGLPSNSPVQSQGVARLTTARQLSFGPLSASTMAGPQAAPSAEAHSIPAATTGSEATGGAAASPADDADAPGQVTYDVIGSLPAHSSATGGAPGDYQTDRRAHASSCRSQTSSPHTSLLPMSIALPAHPGASSLPAAALAPPVSRGTCPGV